MNIELSTEELEILADTLSRKVLEKIKPLLQGNGKDNNGLFTVETLAQYLNIPKSTIYKMTSLNEIPYLKIGNTLRFRGTDIDKWLQESYTPSLNGVSNHFLGRMEK